MSKFSVAALAKNSELTEKLSRVLDTICSDGTLDAIHTLWYGSTPLSLANTLVSDVVIDESDAGNNSDETQDDTTSDSADSQSTAAEEQPLTVDINDVNR